MDESSIGTVMVVGACRTGLEVMETQMVYPHTHFIGFLQK
jgi:hypothetical protein